MGRRLRHCKDTAKTAKTSAKTAKTAKTELTWVLYVLRYVLLLVVRVQVLLSTYRYIQYGIRSSTYSTEYVLVHTSTVCTAMVCVGERGTVCECDFDDA